MKKSLTVCVLLALAASAFSQDVTFDKATLSFADKAAASERLIVVDSFLSAMSPLDRSLRMKTDKDVSVDEYRAFLKGQALDWTADEKAKIERVARAVAARMNGYPLKFPSSIVFIKTTGKEEGNAAYCRGSDAVVFPAGYLTQNENALRDLLAHELFHIWSRNNPVGRDRLYNSIGFEKCPPLSGLAPGFESILITNPDAHLYDYWFVTKIEGKKGYVMPLLLATSSYDESVGGEFFHYFTLYFMALREQDGATIPLVKDSRYALLAIDQVEGYDERVGRNTDYIIHPDEILADNFVYLINEKKGLASPEIVAGMKRILASSQ